MSLCPTAMHHSAHRYAGRSEGAESSSQSGEIAEFCVSLYGTPNGDMGPCIAIARAMVCRAHSVKVATHESCRELVAEQGIDIIDTLPTLSSEEGVEWFEYAIQSNMKEWRYLARSLIPHFGTNAIRRSNDADFEVMLCTQGTMFAPILSEKLGIPWGMFSCQRLNGRKYPSVYPWQQTSAE